MKSDQFFYNGGVQFQGIPSIAMPDTNTIPNTITITPNMTGGTFYMNPSKWQFCPTCGQKLEQQWNNCPGCGKFIGLA
jgi:hypothetical protein